MLEPKVKLLGEDERVWTESVPAERRVLEISRVLHFTQACFFQHFTHFFNTMECETQNMLYLFYLRHRHHGALVFLPKDRVLTTNLNIDTIHW